MAEPGKTPFFKPLSDDLLKRSPDEDKLSMSHNKQGTLKRAHVSVLREGYRAPFDKVVIGLLDEEGSEAGIRVAEPADAAAVKLHKTQTDTGARFSMARLVKQFPALKVAKGRVRLFPITQRVIDGTTFLVLDLVNTTVGLADTRGNAAAAQAEQVEPDKQDE